MPDRRRDTKLDSWKVIAAFLSHDVSTARRWEKESGLPIHRLPGNKRHAIYAYAQELDAWLRGRGEPLVLPVPPARDLPLGASPVGAEAIIQTAPETGPPITALKDSSIEFIDSKEFAKRLRLPESWVRHQVRASSDDPLPHLKLGRYVRFEWESPDLLEWLARHRVCRHGTQRTDSPRDA